MKKDTRKRLHLMAYNIQDMHNLFDDKKMCLKEDEGSIKRIESINQIILNVKPHILGVVEAPNQQWRNNQFRHQSSLKSLDLKVVSANQESSEKHALAIFYREPLMVVAVDEHKDFYQPWTEDIDDDSIEELVSFDRIPLEVRFRNSDTGKEFLVIFVALKSKYVNQPTDIIRFHTLALANRKKLLAQSKKIRERLELLLDEKPDLPIILMGDFNDSPGLDSYEKQIGISALETLMGSVFEPDRIFHNVFSHWRKDPDLARKLFSSSFIDPIVCNSQPRRVWLDHILLSPHFRSRQEDMSHVVESSMIYNDSSKAKMASDHFPVVCHLAYSSKED